MKRTTCPEKVFQSVLLAAVLISLSACGGGSGTADTALDSPLADQSVGTSTLGAGQGLTEFTPDTGLQINYDDTTPFIQDKSSYVEEQWLYMQTCLQQTAQEPVVDIVDGDISPLADSDEVIRHIDGKVQATVHITDTDASIQISAADFDGSIGTPGSYLRSILGRYLWLSANLSERDYPYSCALGE